MATHHLSETNKVITVNEGDYVVLPDIRTVVHEFVCNITMTGGTNNCSIVPYGNQEINGAMGTFAVTSNRVIILSMGIPSRSWNLASTEVGQDGGGSGFDIPDPATGNYDDALVTRGGVYVLVTPPSFVARDASGLRYRTVTNGNMTITDPEIDRDDMYAIFRTSAGSPSVTFPAPAEYWGGRRIYLNNLSGFSLNISGNTVYDPVTETTITSVPNGTLMEIRCANDSNVYKWFQISQ